MTFFRKGNKESPEIYMASGGKFAPAAGIIGGLVLVVILLFASIAYVPPGHVGVLTLFGRVTDEWLPEGTHLINPFKGNNRLSIRTQTLKETASVPSTEGLMMTLDTSLLYRLDPTMAPKVFRTIGPRYEEVIVEPTLRSAIRSVTASHSANALYTGGREQVAQQIRSELIKQLVDRGLIVESVLLRDVQLPPTLRTSIEAKQRAEQEALQMSFVLQKEKQEAERKRIEAQGIADFQRIVAQGISSQLLTWKGIEATEKLAASPNAKIIMIGSPRTGLPLILEPK